MVKANSETIWPRRAGARAQPFFGGLRLAKARSEPSRLADTGLATPKPSHANYHGSSDAHAPNHTSPVLRLASGVSN
eukprot:11176660-Lingulodinium_polyedra.AAC.2